MSDPITPAALAKGLVGILAPAAGATLSLRFNTRDLTTRARIGAVGGSFGLAWYIGGAVAAHLALPEPVTHGLMFLLGLFGLNVAATLNDQLPTLITTARRRYFGDEA